MKKPKQNLAKFSDDIAAIKAEIISRTKMPEQYRLVCLRENKEGYLVFHLMHPQSSIGYPFLFWEECTGYQLDIRKWNKREQVTEVLYLTFKPTTTHE